MNINWYDEVLKRKDELINDLQAIIRIKSELDEANKTPNAPFGEGIKEALDFFLALGEKDGMNIKNVENVAGHVEFGTGSEYVGILGHLDVVPAGNDWSFDPYGAELKDGKIYGRGTQDDKGPTIAAYYGMKIVRDLNLELSKRVRLIVGCDEESGWRCLPRYFELEERPALGFVPDAEFPIIYGEKGIMVWEITGSNNTASDLINFKSGFRNNMVPDFAEVTVSDEKYVTLFNDYCTKSNHPGKTTTNANGYILRITGKSAHGAQPHKGVNAAFLMLEFLNEVGISNDFTKIMNEYLLNDSLGLKFGISFTHDEMGPLTINTGIVEYDNNKYKVVLNPRYPKGFDVEASLKKVEDELNKLGANLKVVKHTPLMYIDPNGPLVKTLHEVYVKHTGDTESKLMTIGGGTYSRLTDNVVAFGSQFPGFEDRMHQLDEYAVVEDILKATAIYAEAIYKLAK